MAGILEVWIDSLLVKKTWISILRQLIGEDDPMLWLSRGDLKGETESEITAARLGMTIQISCNKNITRTKIVNNANKMERPYSTYLHALYWQKKNTSRGMIECVLTYTLIYARKMGQI